jgi:hypothetical protein
MLMKSYMPIKIIGLLLILISGKISGAEVRFLALPKDQTNIAGSLPEIYLDGEIDRNTLNQIKNIVNKHKLNQAKVIFNSDGGNLMGAIEIGEYLRENEFSTDVGTYDGQWNQSRTGDCYSSCVYAYIGGKYRFFDRNSKFGVHQFYSIDQKDVTIKDVEQGSQFIASYLVNYISDMGVDIKLFTKISEQDSDDIELLDYDEMKNLGIFNNGYLKSKWEYFLGAEGAYLLGTQEQIDRKGVVFFGCQNNDVEISFVTKFGSDNFKSKYTNHLIIEEEILDITDKTRESEIDDEGIITVSYAPSSNEILKLMKAEYLGFKHIINTSEYGYTIDIYSESKEKILSFIEFCEK